MDLWAQLKERMLKYPSQQICEPDAVLTYEEMVILAESLGRALEGQTCCAIYCRSELFTAMAILGCFSANITAVPLSFRYGHRHCNKILQSVSPSCVITDVDGKFGIYDILDSEYKSPRKKPSLIMYTSGTTGFPKGAMFGDESILTNVRDILSYFPLFSTDTILISRPLYHCAVLTGEFLTSLTRGAKIIFFSEPFHPTRILETIKREKVSVFGGTPTLLETLSCFIRAPKSLNVKKLIVSGECLSETSAQRIRKAFPLAHIHHVYGLTEACPRVSHLPAESFDYRPDCVGYPLNSVKIKILDEYGKPVSKGDAGMLWVQGKNVMYGYYNNPKMTKSVLRNGWLCTGDTARITEEGFLQIKGRKDDLIIRAGMNIYPQEIEGEMKKDPRTKEVLVYGIQEGLGGTQIAMKIAGLFQDVNEVRELCVKVLPPYQMPTKIELVDSIRKNGTGKVIRGKSDA